MANNTKTTKANAEATKEVETTNAEATKDNKASKPTVEQINEKKNKKTVKPLKKMGGLFRL